MRLELQSLCSPFLISGFLPLSTLVNVGHIDPIMLSIDVLSSLSLLAYNCYLFDSCLCLLSLLLEAHYYKHKTKHKQWRQSWWNSWQQQTPMSQLDGNNIQPPESSSSVYMHAYLSVSAFTVWLWSVPFRSLLSRSRCLEREAEPKGTCT